MRLIDDEEFCPERDDEQHCNCWYDGLECCACGAPADPQALGDLEEELESYDLLDDEEYFEEFA